MRHHSFGAALERSKGSEKCHRHFHVRHRHREQRARRSTAAGRASTRWKAAAITSAGRRISPSSRRWASVTSATGPPIHKTWLGDGQVRLGVRRPDLRRPETAQHRADRRPVPFRRARLDRQLPEPGLSRAFCALCQAFAERFPWVQLYTPGQRDVHLRHVFGALRLVERAAEPAIRRSSPRSSTSSRPTSSPCGRS